MASSAFSEPSIGRYVLWETKRTSEREKIPDFLAKLLRELLHFLEVLLKLFGEHALSQLGQIRLHESAKRGEFLSVVVDVLKPECFWIEIAWRLGSNDRRRPIPTWHTL